MELAVIRDWRRSVLKNGLTIRDQEVEGLIVADRVDGWGLAVERLRGPAVRHYVRPYGQRYIAIKGNEARSWALHLGPDVQRQARRVQDQLHEDLAWAMGDIDREFDCCMGYPVVCPLGTQ